jgi:ATP-dependent helicase HrpA
VTVTVPRAGLAQLSPERLDWLAPGLLEEKVTALIKALPKQVRRTLTPAADTARAVLGQLRYGEGDFHAVVATELSRIAGERVSPDMFDLERLPPHLRMNVKVVDDAGATVAKGRDLRELRAQVSAQPAPPEKPSAKSAAVETRWRRDGITAWDFGDLPEHVDIERGGIEVHAFPALVDAGESVSLRLFDSVGAAQQSMRSGLRRLFILTVRPGLKSAVGWIPKLDEALVKLSPLAKPAEWKQQLGELIADRAAFGDGETPSIRTAAEFTTFANAGRERLGGGAQDVARLVPLLAAAYQQARLALEGAKAPNAKYALDDIREQLAALMPPGFLTATPWNWLEQFPRFLQGVQQRLSKLAGGLSKDRGLFDKLQPVWRRYVERRALHDRLGVADPELAHYRWLVEEYRVSLFAQTLGTSVSVSPERLEKQWAKVRS